MKTTRYFEFTRLRSDRKEIQDEWILAAIRDPVHESIQSDGRIRKWTWIEKKARFLRVILLEDGETVHNAFFDRSFKPEDQKDEDQLF